jgi:hypothetical protein
VSARVEGRFTIPASTTASVSSGAHTTAVTVTTPAANYFHTAAGGVSSWATTFQTQLNNNVQGYPLSAAAVAAAVGYGTWTTGAGWLCNESSGSLAAAFGAPSLTAVSTPTYGSTGPRGGVDFSVGFNSALDAFSGGDVFDSTATDDLIWAGVIYLPSMSVNSDLMGKGADAAHTLPGYTLVTAADGNLYWILQDGVDFTFGTVALSAQQYYACIAVADRTTNKGRVGVCNLSTSAVTVSAEFDISTIGSMGNAQNFTIGASGYFAGTGSTAQIAAHYIVSGANVATGLSANLSTAVLNFANACNSYFTVSTSTSTGLTTISNSFWPIDITWTSTAQRDVAGYDRNITYPATAAQMATAVGYGTWTSGAAWLCNEASGDLAPVFGTGTLADAGTPLYSIQGPRGGTDKAVGFDSATDGFNGGDIFDTDATYDLCFAWVGKVDSTPAGNLSWFGKGTGAACWYVYRDNAGKLNLNLNNAVAAQTATAVVQGEWHVGAIVVERGTNRARIATIGIRSGTSSISAELDITAQGTLADADPLLVGAGVLAPDVDLELAYMAITTGSSVATGLSANLSTALSNFATSLKSQTGTQQARGIWFPGCPVNLDGDPSVAPKTTDRRASLGPTGTLTALSGTARYRHRNIHWPAVDRSAAWEAHATYDNASWETFANDCMGLGHAWMSASTPLQIYWNDAGTDRALGYTFNDSAGIPGWGVVNLTSTEPAKAVGQWTGLWKIVLGDVVSSGE